AEQCDAPDAAVEAPALAQAEARVTRDVESAAASGVRFTPTFFINGRRYDGAWDESSFADAMLGSLGYRVRAAALEFASWAPAAGMLLLLATALALLISNSGLSGGFEAFWNTGFGIAFGDLGFEMSLRHWVNDALLTIFFLVVGLEIKREFTVGHLANRRSAALPIAAAIGGMLLPALVYVALVPPGPWTRGWGVPMATDTAFAVALIAMMGRRVPLELRIFLTAAAIVDDIGAILVVAIFYSNDLQPGWLASAAFFTALLVLLNRSGVYRPSPYIMIGIALWACVHAGGLHATLAGVILAAIIPTRPPPNYDTLATQADSILANEARHGGEQLRHGPSEPALRALDAIHDRLLSPADRMLRTMAPRSSLVVLPLFALANAGVAFSGDVFSGNGGLMLAIVAGLAVGKPLGFVLFCLLAVRSGLAAKADAMSWRQLAGAGALAGIGFTMSLFIAGQAYPVPDEFAAAKIAVFAGSLLSAVIGVALLWNAAASASGSGRRSGSPRSIGRPAASASRSPASMSRKAESGCAPSASRSFAKNARAAAAAATSKISASVNPCRFSSSASSRVTADASTATLRAKRTTAASAACSTGRAGSANMARASSAGTYFVSARPCASAQ
ncbi:MAG: Na+/H+ antiporter NhaA, partial [Gammaproteobacteria bacterium]|nr:Na+/H+ antiporter NhaA [Gammaproteobacteria bacterium]